MFSTTSFTIDGLSVHIKTGNCTTTSIIMHATILTIFSSTAFAASPSTAAVLHAADDALHRAVRLHIPSIRCSDAHNSYTTWRTQICICIALVFVCYKVYTDDILSTLSRSKDQRSSIDHGKQLLHCGCRRGQLSSAVHEALGCQSNFLHVN